jgi:hypothetical protein
MSPTPVADAILAQLGGRRFLVMTGASHLMGGADCLSFKLPRRFAKAGINHIKITLDANDTYTFQGYKLGRAKLTLIQETSGVYADSLRDIFTRATGLDTSLGTAT